MPRMRGRTWRSDAVGVVFAALGLCGAAAADTICVPDDHDTIQEAIDAASDGDEICVAPGTYDEAIDFRGKAVRLFSTDGPDVTIIDAGQLEPPTAVVKCITSEGPETVLDGFTLTGGTGVWRPEPYDGHYGGGMFNEGSSPTVTNCTFIANTVDWAGGGMANHDSSPTVTDCSFIDNSARDGGGGMANHRSSPTVTNCSFIGNGARDGGGMSNWHESSPTVTNCTFADNIADNRGGGMSNWYASDALLADCTLTRNIAGVRGGGMYNGFSTLAVRHCGFTENTADSNAGAMYNYESHTVVTDCAFTRNTARLNRGGAMYNFYSAPVMTGCTFSENSADNDRGGAICNYRSNAAVTNCTFRANHATRGGGVYDSRGSPTLTNCAFVENTVTSRGGALFSFTSDPTVVNCTFRSNAAVRGRALACDSYAWDPPSDVRMLNCILWNGGEEIVNDDGSTIVIAYSDVTGGYDGVGNIDADPMCDAAGRVRAGSPCIDAGANNAVPADRLDLNQDGVTFERIPIDLDGNHRFMDDDATEDSGCGPTVVDMGAFEFPGEPMHPVLIGDVDGDGAVGFGDLVAVLNAWGPCESRCCRADIDFSLEVSFDDLLLVLMNWR